MMRKNSIAIRVSVGLHYLTHWLVTLVSSTCSRTCVPALACKQGPLCKRPRLDLDLWRRGGISHRRSKSSTSLLRDSVCKRVEKLHAWLVSANRLCTAIQRQSRESRYAFSGFRKTP